MSWMSVWSSSLERWDRSRSSADDLLPALEPLAGCRCLAGQASVRGAFRQFEQAGTGLRRRNPFQDLHGPQGPKLARREDAILHVLEHALGPTPGLGRGGSGHNLAERGRHGWPLLSEVRRRSLAGGEVVLVEVRDQGLHTGQVGRARN